MGGFYGSIHVRTDNGDEVRAAVESLNHEGTSRFFIAPPINGWVTIFPENNGQDETLTAALAAKLRDKTIIHCAVHDDDIFAYWLFEAGELADSYNSCPGYFGEENPEPRGGNAAAFAKLIDPAKVAKLQTLLDADRYTFELERQDKFAELIGLPNTGAAYEYIESGDAGDVQKRKQFIHIPDLTEEKNARGAARAELREKLKQLQRDHVLLVNEKSGKGSNKYFYRVVTWALNPRAPEALAMWGDLLGLDSSPNWKRFAGPSWEESAIDPTLTGVATALQFSESGRLLAKIVNRRRIEVWDLSIKRIAFERNYNGDVSAIAFARDEKSLFAVVRNEPKTGLHRISLDLRFVDQVAESAQLHFKRILPHPAGEMIAVIDNFGILLVFETKTMQMIAQRWIPDPNSLLLHDQFTEVAQQMTSDLMKHIGLREAQLYRESSQRHFLPKDGIHSARFNDEGNWLFCGTQVGLRGLLWQDILAGPELTAIKPSFVAEAEREPSETKHPFENQNRLIYDIAFDTELQRVLYAGIEGKISFYNLLDGSSGTLLSVPDNAALMALGLSADRTALIGTAHKFDFERNKQHPQHFQIWNYRALCEAAGVEH